MSPVVGLDLGLQSTHVLVTGGAGMIGSAVVSAFLSAGARVTVFDISTPKIEALQKAVSEDAANGLYPVPQPILSCHDVDITDEEGLHNAWTQAEKDYGPVACCVALGGLDLSALPHHDGGIADTSLDQWTRTITTNVTGTFLTAREWVRGLLRHKTSSGAAETPQPPPLPANCSLIIVGSESGLFGERSNLDYATGKSAVQGGLLASLKADVPRQLGPNVRVNAVAPGPVDTPQFRRECEEDPNQFYADARGTVALGKPVDMASVARSVVFLASDSWSGSVHGAVLRVDCGKEGKLIWWPNE